MSIRTVTNNLLDTRSLFLVIFAMFAAKNPSSRTPLLSDLCELCVNNASHSLRALLSRPGHPFALPANSHRMIFLAHPRHLTPMESYSCKDRGRGRLGPKLRS